MILFLEFFNVMRINIMIVFEGGSSIVFNIALYELKFKLLALSIIIKHFDFHLHWSSLFDL